LVFQAGLLKHAARSDVFRIARGPYAGNVWIGNKAFD
jgi:hypothetical protein